MTKKCTADLPALQAWLNVATALGICIAVTANTDTPVLVLAVVQAAAIALTGIYIGVKRNTVMYVLALLWAFAGVYVKQASEVVEIRYTTIVALVGLAVSAAFALSRSGSRRHNRLTPQAS
jgi:hypothetical protein